MFFLMRIYWAFVGNRHARQIFYLPVWDLHLVEGRDLGGELVRLPGRRSRRNTSATTRWRRSSMFFVVTLGTIGMIITGFALYSEGAGRDSWQAKLFGWVFTIFPNSQDVHTLHHLGMWVIVMLRHHACLRRGARGDHVAPDHDRHHDLRRAAVPRRAR